MQEKRLQGIGHDVGLPNSSGPPWGWPKSRINGASCNLQTTTADSNFGRPGTLLVKGSKTLKAHRIDLSVQQPGISSFWNRGQFLQSVH